MNTPIPNILIFIDWFLPGTKAGGPVRSMANLTEQLAGNFTFWIVTRNTDYCETTPYNNIEPNKWTQLAANINVFYASKDHQNKKTFEPIINNPKFNKIYINGIYSYSFSILPLKIAQKAKKTIIVAPRGMLNSQAFSVKPLKKRIFISVAKLLKLYNNVTFHATNADEKTYILEQIGAHSKVQIAPNLPRKIAAQQTNPLHKQVGEVKLVNIARISPEKGTLHILKFAQKIKTGNVSIDIYGPIYNQEYWNECKKIIAHLPQNITVNYQGAVEGELVPEVLKKYHFFIMPSEGENFGHSILEALSAGCPVIISDKTPWKNLKEKAVGWDIPLTDDDTFAKIIDATANMSDSEYKTLSVNAFTFAKQFSEDESLLSQTSNLFSD